MVTHAQRLKNGITTALLALLSLAWVYPVVMILLNSVCEKLRQMSIAKITASKKQGVALKNEMSNYNNSLRSIRDVLLDNENYVRCPLYRRLQRDITRYITRTILDMKRRGEIQGDSYLTVLRNLRDVQR